MSQEIRPKTPDNPNLLSYLLNYTPPVIPLQPEMLLKNPDPTLSKQYDWRDITYLPQHWASFNLEEIVSSFHRELHAPLPEELKDVWMSPPDAIRTETQLHECAWRSVYTQLRRALGAVVLRPHFSRMRDIHGEGIPNGTKADRIGVAEDGGVRLVGDLKPSWNFRSSWRDEGPRSVKEKSYRQALSQVNFYMHRKGVRYGYLLTDREFVALRRGGSKYGDLEVAAGVSWSHGAADCSVALALFGLHMMAAKEDSWEVARMARPTMWIDMFYDDDGEDEESSAVESGMDMDSSWCLRSSDMERE